MKPSAAFGCEKHVGLKSRPRPIFFAHEIQPLKCLGRDFVAIHFFAAELAVERVQVQTMFAGNQRIRFFQIGTEFVRRARLAGMIAGGDQSAAERAAEIFKATHVVALPAVERNRYLREHFQRAVNVHAEIRIAFPGQRKGLFNFIVHGEPRLENVVVNILRVCLKEKSPGFFGGATANSAPTTGLIPRHS